MNIVLIGMAGSGKSTIGKMLAKNLKRKLLETDVFVEKKTKMAISKFVEKSGWEEFRILESEAVGQISHSDNIIISTGGGVVTREINITRLKKNGIFIWLKAGVDTLAERLGDGKGRPLFGYSGIIKKEISKMYADRKSLYKKTGDFIIETDNKTPKEVMTEIISALKVKKLL